MKTKKDIRIGLDLDQVLCDFYGPYVKLFGEPKSDFEITKNVNRKLSKDKTFWLLLPIINKPNFEPALYCSKRVNPKEWSKQWLKQNGLPNKPFYQVWLQEQNKADFIKGRVDLFIDDSVSNWKQLNEAGIPCLLMDCEYNRNIDTPLRIYSLDIDEIMRVYEQFK